MAALNSIPVGAGKLRSALAVLFLAVLALAPAMRAYAHGPESVADVAAPLLDAVVNISTSQTVSGSKGIPPPQLPEGSPFQDFFDDFFDQKNGEDNRPHKVQSLGSGFVIDPSGLIVTNNHVIEGADEITANFNDGSKMKAKLLGHDEKTDIALLKVEAKKPLTYVKLGNSDLMRVGDWVMAIGNPFGLGGTLTVGIISARNRDINAGPYDNFIQTDAAINRGNSGGPLFNMDGEVIGINTAIISPSGGSIGIGFAIPSATAVNVIQQLRDFGETRRGWLGVRIQDITDDIAEGLGMTGVKGALVAGVTENGPAAAAGVLPGDVILEFAGTPVDSSHALPRLVADEPVGKAVTLKLLRKGQELTVTAKLGRLEDADKAAAAKEEKPAPVPEPNPDAPAGVVPGPLGLSLSELTPGMRSQYGIKDEGISGVVITGVAAGSPGEEKRIQPGDVIVEVGQERVSTPGEVTDRIAALKKDGRSSVQLLLSDRNGILRFVDVKIPD